MQDCIACPPHGVHSMPFTPHASHRMAFTPFACRFVVHHSPSIASSRMPTPRARPRAPDASPSTRSAHPPSRASPYPPAFLRLPRPPPTSSLLLPPPSTSSRLLSSPPAQHVQFRALLSPFSRPLSPSLTFSHLLLPSPASSTNGTSGRVTPARHQTCRHGRRCACPSTTRRARTVRRRGSNLKL